MNIYIDTDEGGVKMFNNRIYKTGRYNTFERDRADGIRISNENADLLGADPTPGVDNISIMDNSIENTGAGIRFLRYREGPSYLMRSQIRRNRIRVGAGLGAIEISAGTENQVDDNQVESGRVSLP